MCYSLLFFTSFSFFILRYSLIKDQDERPSSLGILVHPFIQTTKGPEVFKTLIHGELRERKK